MTTTENLTVLNLTNNDSLVTGIARHGDTFTALTLSQSKTFKTERGAITWLAVRGYAPNGKRLG